MDFEEWFNSLELDNWTNKKYMHDAFEAGQQSKQAEIDALKSKVQELWTELDDRQTKEYIIEKCEEIIREILKLPQNKCKKL